MEPPAVLDNNTKPSEVLLAALTQDVAHILQMLSDLKSAMSTAENKYNDHLDRVKTELTKVDESSRADLVKANEALRADMRTAIQELKEVQTKLEARLVITDEKATSAKDSASRMVWVTVGVLGVLVAFAASLLVAKLTK